MRHTDKSPIFDLAADNTAPTANGNNAVTRTLDLGNAVRKTSMFNTYPWGKKSSKTRGGSAHDWVGTNYGIDMGIFTISSSHVTCLKFNLDEHGESELTKSGSCKDLCEVTSE